MSTRSLYTWEVENSRSRRSVAVVMRVRVMRENRAWGTWVVREGRTWGGEGRAWGSSPIVWKSCVAVVMRLRVVREDRAWGSYVRVVREAARVVREGRVVGRASILKIVGRAWGSYERDMIVCVTLYSHLAPSEDLAAYSFAAVLDLWETQRGVSNVFLTYFNSFFGGQYKLGRFEVTRGGYPPPPPRQIEHCIADFDFLFINSYRLYQHLLWSRWAAWTWMMQHCNGGAT